MFLFLQLLALTLLLLLGQEVLRRAKPWAVAALFFLVPIVLAPYWIQINTLGLFPWLKGYSVFIAVCWVTALRYTPLGKHDWARAGIPLLLAANIFEAVVVDLYGSGWSHSLNAAAGLLLIATSIYGPMSTQIGPKSSGSDMLYQTSRAWIIGYTIWNWTFLYLNYPFLVGYQTAVLAAALIVGMFYPHRWAQTRAATLGLSLLFSATYLSEMVSWLDGTSWLDDKIAFLAAGCGFLFMATHLLNNTSAQAWRSHHEQSTRRLTSSQWGRTSRLVLR